LVIGVSESNSIIENYQEEENHERQTNFASHFFVFIELGYGSLRAGSKHPPLP
jgi:hypothetical protein